VERVPFQLASCTLDAEQVVAFPLPQVRVAEPPSAIVAKSLVSVGAGGGTTLTIRFVNSEAPPKPSHVRVYVDVAVGDTTCVPPAISRPPAQFVSSTLEAVQLVAFPLPQVRVAEPPSAIVVMLAESVGPGGGPTFTTTLVTSEAPPNPAQVRTYSAVAVGETTWFPPDTSLPPFHAGSCGLLALQLVAFTLPQVSVLEPPPAIVGMSAVSKGPGASPTVTVTFATWLAPPAPSHVRV
jgi:hypothetical protein